MRSTFTSDNNYIPGFTTIDHTHLRPFPSPLSLWTGLVLLLFVYLAPVVGDLYLALGWFP